MFVHFFLNKLLVLRFTVCVFCDGFFKVTQNVSIFRGNTGKQCRGRQRSIVCEVVTFIVIFHTFYVLVLLFGCFFFV
jgi:hypothetical protein